MKQQTKNRATILGLFGIFLLPVLAAVILQSEWIDWEPPAVKQSGELIQPVVSLAEAQIESLSAKPGQWSLVQIEVAECSDDCIERVDLLAHLHALLGREQEKLNRVVAATSSPSEPPQGFPRLVAIEPFAPLIQPTQDAGLLLVDPLGNAMMRYPLAFDPVGLRADLARLLKKSKFLGEES